MIALLLTEQGLGGRAAHLGERVARFERDESPRARAARRLAESIARRAGGIARGDDARAGAVLARAFPDRVAKARGGGAFLMANGRAASLDMAEPSANAPYIVIADMAGAADRARVLAFAPITQAEIEQLFADRIETRVEVAVDSASGKVRGRRSRRLGRVVLSEAPLERIAPEELEGALINAVRDEGLALLDWSESAVQLRARVALMRALEGEEWPDWSDPALVASLEHWLGSRLAGVAGLKDVNVAQALSATLPHVLRRRLETQAPERFETPAGGSARIDYTADGGPAVDVRLQEMFGVAAHPAIAGGRVALVVRLLSPAMRPVATTKDLPGFWKGAYGDVRSDMRGRYPKHPWPEDPLSAAPTRKAKPRR